MLAMMASQSDVVDLLKNKYDQQEPTPEAVSSLNFIFVCHIYPNRGQAHINAWV